jgi:hypothetical protein
MMSGSESSATFNSRPDGQQRPAPRTLSAYAAIVLAKLRDFAPYAAIELVMPGGSVMALLLWLYRRQKGAPAFPTR